MLVAMTMESRYPFGKDWAATARSVGVDVVVIEVVPHVTGKLLARGITGGGDHYQIEKVNLRPDRYLRTVSERLMGRRISRVLADVGTHRRVDVLHTHFYREMGPVLHMARRPPHVHTEHSASFAALDLGERAQYRPSEHGLRIAREGCAQAQAVTAVADYLIRQMHRYGIDQDILYIPCPVDPALTSRPVEDAANPRRIVSIGRLSPEKRVDRVLDAFARIHSADPDVMLDVVGTGALEPALKEQAARLGIADAVTWHGWLTRPEIADVAASASVSVTATMSEMFGTAVAESLCLGLPVVAPAVGGIPELLNADFDQGELVDDVDTDSLATAVQAVLSRSPDRHAIAQDARTRFSQARVGGDLLDVYRSAIAAAPKQRRRP